MPVSQVREFDAPDGGSEWEKGTLPGSLIQRRSCWYRGPVTLRICPQVPRCWPRTLLHPSGAQPPLLILDRLDVEAESCYLPLCGQESIVDLPRVLLVRGGCLETSLHLSVPIASTRCPLDSRLSPSSAVEGASNSWNKSGYSVREGGGLGEYGDDYVRVLWGS